MLGGGADSFNFLVPSDRAGYREYSDRRGILALQRGGLLPLHDSDGPGRSFSLHPCMKEVAAMYSAGDLAILANTGPLQGLDAYRLDPDHAEFSHSQFIKRWQSGTNDTASGSGWAGRVADVLEFENSIERLPINISLSGRNLMQLGNRTAGADLQSSVYRQRHCPNAAADFSYFNQQLAEKALNTGRPGFIRRRTRLQARTETDYRRLVASALADAPELNVRFGTDEFLADLERVTRMISVRHRLGVHRQIFYVHFDGWDHHHGSIESQVVLTALLSQGLAQFRDALGRLGVLNDVTTFTSSEFGRSLEPLEGGCDHGWGGHHLIMGGAVRGGRIFGQYPQLDGTDPLDVGRGCFIPSTSSDEYLAELALWFGTPLSDLSYVLPDISNFWSVRDGKPPIGLFS